MASSNARRKWETYSPYSTPTAMKKMRGGNVQKFTHKPAP